MEVGIEEGTVEAGMASLEGPFLEEAFDLEASCRVGAVASFLAASSLGVVGPSSCLGEEGPSCLGVAASYQAVAAS